MNEKLPEYHWDPNINRAELVNEEQFIYTFNEKQESGTWRCWHSHESCGELISITDGIMVVLDKKGASYVQINRAVWLPPRLEHEWYMPTRVANRSLYVHESVFAGFEELKDRHVIEVTPLLREIIVAMHDMKFESQNEANKRLGLVLVDQLCSARKYENTLPMPQDHKLIELCTQLMITPDIPITLSDWSEQLNISSKTLARIFVRETGLNFRAWQNRLRMENAKRDMEAGINVTDAALNCGYNSLSSFIAAFRKYYGSSPGVHKRSL